SCVCLLWCLCVAEEVNMEARGFFEMCPVKAASEAKSAESQSCQWHFVTPLTRWTDFRCLFRSVPVAKEAPQTVPHGMSHWHEREVLGADTAERRSCVSFKGSVGETKGVAARG